MSGVDEIHCGREGNGTKVARAVARTPDENVWHNGGGVAQLGFPPGGDRAARAQRYAAFAALVDDCDEVSVDVCVDVWVLVSVEITVLVADEVTDEVAEDVAELVPEDVTVVETVEVTVEVSVVFMQRANFPVC